MKPVVFFYGRMNPFTKGHEMAVRSMIEEYPNHKHLVYVSHTQNKKNPLTPAQKKKLIKRSLPQVSVKRTYPKNPNGLPTTIFDIVQILKKKGHPEIILAAGSDKSVKYKPMFKKYTSTNNVRVVKVGENRNNSGNGKNVKSISGTRARKAATNGNVSLLRSILPNSLTLRNIKSVYATIRKYTL